ncbi:MAG: hypothetical protein KIT09_34110 [Bryobacteraceae bacterium]|nr:hypothetical protein [Bryobacteraceae bacterium]
MAIISLSPVEALRHRAAHVVETLGPTFRPREVRPAPELPKTQSGKVVRRLIRQRYLQEPLGDLSTVANPEAAGGVRRGIAVCRSGAYSPAATRDVRARLMDRVGNR